MPASVDPAACERACEMAQIYSVTPPKGTTQPRELTIYFAHTRTVITMISVLDTPYRPQPGERIVHIPIEGETIQDGTIAIPVSMAWTGEPPLIVKHSWDADKEMFLSADDPRSIDEIYGRRQTAIDDYPQAQAKKREQARQLAAQRQQTGTDLSRIDEAQAAEQDRKCQEQMRFFIALDQATVPPLVKPANPLLALSIRKMTKRLQDRVVMRAAHAVANLDYQGNPSLDPRVLRSAVDVSELLCPMFEPLLATQDGADQTKFDAHFEAFVCGDLSLGRIKEDEITIQSHGGPNGAQFFSFAEAALFMIDHDPDQDRADIWRQTLPTFVRLSEVFTQLYWNGACRVFNAYGYAWRDSNSFTGEKRRRLRLAYQPYTQSTDALRRRFSQTCAYALREDAIRRAPLPIQNQ